MKKQNEFVEITKGLSYLTQLGLSIITPVILCAFLGSFLKKRFNIPDFLLIIIILIGVLSGISSAVSFVKSYLRRIENEEKQNKK